MRPTQPVGEIAPAIKQLVALEERFAANAKQVDDLLEPRVYEWRPSGVPELPAVWNWIDDSPYETPDNAQGDDLLVVATTIGVKPSDLPETMGRLVRLMDIFRATVDPALNVKPILGGTVLEAKRVVTRSLIEEFDGVPVMCLQSLIRLKLRALVR